jgi:hypothetical protein
VDSNAYCDYSPNPIFQTREYRALMDAISFMPPESRKAALLKYSSGYTSWRIAGLPELSGDQLRQVGHSAPDIEQAFDCYIKGIFDVADICG